MRLCLGFSLVFLTSTRPSCTGTFLNHIRLSGPGLESRPFRTRDGDVLQLGVDYQGGAEEIYRCVKIKLELGRGRDWQRTANSFKSVVFPSSADLLHEAHCSLVFSSTNALNQIRTLAGNPAGSPPPSATSNSSFAKARTPTLANASKGRLSTASVTDCCICAFPCPCEALDFLTELSFDFIGLFGVSVCQALFIAPCSHCFHYSVLFSIYFISI
jgi:hypothetical protein